jgi:hypothetical protein
LDGESIFEGLLDIVERVGIPLRRAVEYPGGSKLLSLDVVG